MPSTDGADYPYFPQILKANGDYYSAMVYVRDYHPPYTRNFFETVTVGTNQMAFASIGDSRDYIDSMTLGGLQGSKRGRG
jgi:hypothetical protein